MELIQLPYDERQFIRNHKDLIDDGNWDKFFTTAKYCMVGISWIYQFLMFNVGIDLLHNMSYIPESAFSFCPCNVGDLIVPSNIKSLETRAFSSCGTITSVDLSQTKIKNIPISCFSFSSLKKVILPKSCECIEGTAFHNCEDLTTINLENVKRLRCGGFQDCFNLKSVDLRGFQPGYISKNSNYFNFKYCPLEHITLSSDADEELVNYFTSKFPDADIKFV